MRTWIGFALPCRGFCTGTPQRRGMDWKLRSPGLGHPPSESTHWPSGRLRTWGARRSRRRTCSIGLIVAVDPEVDDLLRSWEIDPDAVRSRIEALAEAEAEAEDEDEDEANPGNEEDGP